MSSAQHQLSAIKAVLLACIFAASCRPVDDGAGSRAPQRIVSLLPSNTEILYALGLGDRVVGVSRFDDYPPDVAAKERVGDYTNTSIEKIVALKPDLVLTQASAHAKDFEESLGRYGIRVVAIRNDRLSELLDAFLVIGDATGTRDRAELLVRQTREKLETTKLRYAGLPRVKVLFILDVQPLYVAGRESYLNDLIEAAGGDNVAASLPGAYPHLSPEVLWQLDPDVILNAALQADFKGFFEPFSKLRAVASGRVHAFDATVVMRPGPRVSEALEEIARQIHS